VAFAKDGQMLVGEPARRQAVANPEGTVTAFKRKMGTDYKYAIRGKELENRVEVAKKELRKFVEKRPDDRIGLIIFSKLPYTVCPPTLDHDFLTGQIATFEGGMLGEATNLAGPLASAVTRLKDSPAKRRVAVFFTDGGNNVQDKISPEQAADLAKTFNVAVYTVGIGSNRAVMPMPGMFGERLMSVGGMDFDPALLKSIAEKTGARYFAARDAEGFGRAMAEIDRLEKVKTETPRYMDYSERFPPLLWAGLALLVLAFLLERTVLQTIP
jgi:Ca-activated chloride channel family protein